MESESSIDFLDHFLYSDALFFPHDDALSHLLAPTSNPDTPISTTISGSGSEPESKPKCAHTTSFHTRPAAGRVTKRKARPSKKSPTTFIIADAANFQQMVQQVTGLHTVSAAGHHQVVLKPETRRVGAGVIHAACLPTLDTSAFLLDHHHVAGDAGVVRPPGGGGEGRRTRFEFDNLVCFPTLESWKVM